MKYCKVDEHGNITNVFETDDEEIAKLNGYETPCDREIVEVYNGSYKFKDETTEDDFKPSAEDIKNDKIFALKMELCATDYKCLKYVDGALTEEEYAEVREHRAELRRQINELESNL